MYIVLVVDDEAIVCQGIKEFLEMSDLNISQVLTASNGYEALDYLRMESIDLVLTDIQMDGMDGIELMESILSEKPSIPVVVISAYDHFEYAQKCIRLGARDYLIKPVLLPQLIQVVGAELSERDGKYKRFLEDSLKLKFSMTGMLSLRSYILNEVITGYLENSDDYLFIFEQIGIKLEGPYYLLLVIELFWERTGAEGGAIHSLRDRNLLKYATVNIIEETLADWNAVAFYGQGNQIVTILQFNEFDNAQRRAENISKLNMIGKTIVTNIRGYLHIEAVVGISPIRLGLPALPESYREAAKAVKWHALYEDHNVFYTEDFSLKEASVQVNWQEKTEFFVESIKTGKKLEDIQGTIHRFITDISLIFESDDSTAGIPLSIAYRIYATLLEMKETVGDQYKVLDPILFFQFPLTGIEIKKRLTDFLTEAAGLIHASMTDHDQAIIQQSIAYIRQNYRKKGLKIQDIAGYVHLSPNYLSYLFKQIIAETVWEYVTRLRMEESRQLLMNTHKKRYEIADEVGYESPEHFSRVFKRYYGESPNAVRE
ncbi:response regulator [Paenibacillus sp. B2(2019)]|uniref:response regulator n=1 Tax=Paenibacillus sp. B2(2019) TaxID=2607754 RepID=UPI0011F228B2|nr:response regulator [Paenibacillus sp. B2(2019)]KAA1183491.1 response regulator [Paenibacillus sp. B2(2019)]